MDGDLKWKYIDIPYAGDEKYRIYEDASIWSEKSNIYVKESLNGYNYRSITLWTEHGQKRFLLHRLYAKAFLPKTEADIKYKRDLVHFKDFDNTNLSLDNLEWVNSLELHMLVEIKNSSKEYKKISDYVEFICKLLERNYEIEDIIKILRLKNTIWARNQIKRIKARKIYTIESAKFRF